MCGIVGLFLKSPKLELELGTHLSKMLVKLSDRGPDSAGLALYTRKDSFDTKLTLRFEDLSSNAELEQVLDKKFKK